VPVVNRLIDGLSPKDRNRILQRSEPVNLAFGRLRTDIRVSKL
jgi:hypothetical protein